jgi:hypothetical protein
LKHLLVILVRRVFDDYCAISFIDFAALLGLALPLIWDFNKSRR